MIGLLSETQVWLPSGATDTRRGFDGPGAAGAGGAEVRDPQLFERFIADCSESSNTPLRSKPDGVMSGLAH
jgi:hypothetical protein